MFRTGCPAAVRRARPVRSSDYDKATRGARVKGFGHRCIYVFIVRRASKRACAAAYENETGFFFRIPQTEFQSNFFEINKNRNIWAL